MTKKKDIKKLNFEYARKRTKKDKKLPPLCPDYEPKSDSNDNCKTADLCKNATYGWENKAMGSCYGGTKASEMEDRKKSLEVSG